MQMHGGGCAAMRQAQRGTPVALGGQKGGVGRERAASSAAGLSASFFASMSGVRRRGCGRALRARGPLWLLWAVRMLGHAAARQSAAVRRLSALMQQEEQQAQQEQQASLQRQRERAAAAQKAAQESGVDAKTKRQYEYVTRKFAAWLEVHGAAAGYV